MIGRRPIGLGQTLAAATLAIGLAGCAALAPDAVGTAERLAAFPTEGLPLERPVTLYWDQHQIPFVQAETDRDAAFVLGLIHGHLRAGQLALLKRVAQGRVSEMIGPPGVDIDHALRLLDFGHAAPEIERRLPPETRAWVEAFVAGLNHHARIAPPPPESGLLGLETEPWTVADILTIGRLAGTDVNWLAYFAYLSARDQPDSATEWRRMVEAGRDGAVSFRGTGERRALAEMLAGASRSGSNTMVVAPERSASGGALIASDPHLGLSLPNLWLIAGVKSPSYHAVGLMVPGLPFIGLGRSPYLAWGGTNMRAASSDLFDVSALPDAALERERVTIVTRWWLDSTREIRRSPLGPVISDSDVVPSRPGEAIALRWVGHEATDEISAFLAAMRARTPDDFRVAFAPFGVSGQNMLFATQGGHIGQVLAAMLPRRDGAAPLDGPVRPPSEAWQGFVGSTDLPAVVDPPEGFVASANNRPAADSPVPIGFLFSDDERVRRLQALVREKEPVSVEDLAAILTDVTSPASARTARELLALIEEAGGAGDAAGFLAPLRGWDGRYDVDARAPVVFELLLFHVVAGLYGDGDPEAVSDFVGQWSFLTTYLVSDLRAVGPAQRAALLRDAVTAAADDAAAFPDWGSMHRVQVGHWLANLPVLGRAFVLDDLPAPGSRETPLKRAHDLVDGRHDARYGSMARHISDMADPDANLFVLFGGQDGWLGSTNFADQLPLWRGGRFIRVPLRAARVAETFRYRQELRPGG